MEDFTFGHLFTRRPFLSPFIGCSHTPVHSSVALDYMPFRRTLVLPSFAAGQLVQLNSFFLCFRDKRSLFISSATAPKALRGYNSHGGDVTLGSIKCDH